MASLKNNLYNLVKWCSVIIVLHALCFSSISIAKALSVGANINASQLSFVADSIISQQVTTGKLTRRAKAAQTRSIVHKKEEVAKKDTVILTLDAIKALARDSSARIEQFQHVRRDKYIEDGKYHKTHPMYLPEPDIIKLQTNLDSTKWSYRLRRVLDDFDIRIPTDLELEDYSALRLNQTIRYNWESLSQFYELPGETKTTLGDVLGKITKIEIPVPKNPIFSIFGPSRILMIINGAITIHAGFRHTKSDLATSSPLGQSRSEPDFKQEISVNVKGEIGDKLKINADWNTQRTFEYENQLHVKYQGYEDEIVQSIEAGNVSLPTRSSFYNGGSALFGIKAQFQFGPLNLTTVATQKKGEIKQLSVSGGAQSSPFEIRPTAFADNHFFIDESYINIYEQMFQTPRYPIDSMVISEIEVWVKNTTTPDERDRTVNAYIDQSLVLEKQNDSTARNSDPTLESGVLEKGRFRKLEQSEYELDSEAGILTLRSGIRDDQSVAVSYTAKHANGKLKVVGNFGDRTPAGEKLILKLVRPPALNPTMKKAWKLKLKNRYLLGGRDIDINSLEFNIEYKLSGQEPVREVFQNIGLLEIFGLDRLTNNQLAGPDKVFDVIEGITIDSRRGEIIFPTIEPFSYNSIAKYLRLRGMAEDSIKIIADSLSFQAIYDTSVYVATNDVKNRFFFRGKLTAARASEIRIPTFNIVEGSIEVYSGGQRLTPNVDYTVDYISNKVIIKNQAYLVAGRDIQVKYEANDLFQLASKSLIGIRGDIDLGKSSSLGFTLLNYSQQSLSDKIRIGEEPISNTILGIDGNTMFETPWLTKALNYLPGVKTTAQSHVSIGGELAYILPNPNTRTSPISGDGDKGVAYIDDFEGARQTIPLGTAYAAWKDASSPWFIPDLDLFDPKEPIVPTNENLIWSGKILADSIKMNYKGRASWFNIVPTDLSVYSIWDEDKKSVAQGEGQITSLDFYFRPAERGAFNYAINNDSLENTIGLGKTAPNSHRKAWAGIQRLLSASTTDLIRDNISYIEFWINIVGGQDNLAKLYIDLGYISEDVIPNRQLNTEDGLDNPSRTPRGILNPKYDWGLDTMDNATEQKYYSENGFLKRYPQFSADPSGDNWKRLPTGRILSIGNAADYDGVNGTEGNYQSEEGQMPDSEDLNRDNSVDRRNDYFEYEIPLEVNSEGFQKFKAGSGKNNWYQLRIPISEFARKIGSPTFTNIEGVRLWVTGADAPVLFRVVDFNLVGNQWEKRVRTDTTYEITVVNIEDNPEYKSPPGVARQRDRTRPDQEIYGNEQSLSLIVKKLSDGMFKEAVKYYNASRPIDMFNYRTLKMFVHGQAIDDPIKGYKRFNDNGSSATMFLRFGDDTSHYYEYRSPVLPGWIGNEIEIKFADLTALKSLRVSPTDIVTRPAPGSALGATYTVHGNPRLDKIQFISIGIENPVGIGDTTISGELWVNELRLTDVDDTPGWAYKVNTSIKFADIGNIGFAYTERDPFFHGLEERFGSRSTSRNWNLTASFSVTKLIPESWNGTTMELSYSHSESMNKPRYLPGQDVLVEEAAAQIQSELNRGEPDTSTSKRQYKDANEVRMNSEELSISDSYSAQNIRLNIPVNTWLITETINKMTFNYSYSSARQRSPTIEYSETWNWSASFNYGTQFNPNNFLTPISMASSFSLLQPWKNLKFYYTPKSINFRATLNRNQSKSKARTATVEAMNHNLVAQRGMDFNWQFFEGGLLDFGVNYNVAISSSLFHLNANKAGKLRSMTDIMSDLFFYKKLINFGVDQTYNQTMNFNTKVTSPKVFSLDKIFTPNFRYSVGYNWTNNISAGPIGKSAAWNSNPSFSLDVNVKPIAAAIWPPTPATVARVDTGSEKKSKNPLQQLGSISRILIKTPFFDFDKFTFNFSQTNSSQNTGVFGSNGFPNLFARVPFFQSSLAENGPSMWYQLGLASNPNGRLILKTKSTFPFITGYTQTGIRAANASIMDNFTQSNQLSMQTSRPLWVGANLQLNWKIGWSYNENISSNTDAEGRVIPRTISTSGDIDRSFITLPPVLIFKIFGTGLEKVNNKFESYKQKEPDETKHIALLSKSFEEGLEVFPWLSKIIGPMAPRANWSIRWSGLEKFSIFKNFASNVSLDHVYTSNYRQRWRIAQTGERLTESQTIMYGFSPLIGINIAFKEILKGSLSSNVRFGTTTNFDLSPSQQNISEGSTTDFSITASFSRRGFEIPLFGISLVNNIDISFNYSYSHNSRITYNFKSFKPEGSPLEGSSRTTMEPRIRYTLSDRVTASFYYRYTRIKPDEGGSRIPGSTINEGGLDINVSIR